MRPIWNGFCEILHKLNILVALPESKNGTLSQWLQALHVVYTQKLELEEVRMCAGQ
jgi:hypothetical protein